jgi:hypothetical protein
MEAPRLALVPWLLASVAAFGCATGATDLGGDADGTGGADGDASEPVACSVNLPCPPGSICRNGACAQGCNGDGDCASDEFCAMELGQVCQPKEAPSCPGNPCAETQVCAEGVCAMQTGAACGAGPFNPQDGCPPDQVCMEQMNVDGTLIEAKQCYALPPCGPDLACSVGTRGALCSATIMTDKAALCLPGICLGSEHCPTSSACVRNAPSDLYGRCTDGTDGSLCASTADCTSSTCVIETPGMLGVCQP